MYRDLLTNKWVLGGIGFLIVFAVGCYFWYQHDTAPDRKAAAEAQELLRQSEKLKKASKIGNKAEQATNGTAADSITPTADKQRTDTTLVTKDIEPTQAQTRLSTENAETEEVRVSPHGFGPYPEVPEDYPLTAAWERNPDNPDITQELMSRVFIKLWTSGEKNFYGGSTHNGMIYPHYNDTVYVRWAEWTDENGKLMRRISGTKSGLEVRRRFKFTWDDLYNPPPGLRVLDIDSSGIDPYQYLNLR